MTEESIVSDPIEDAAALVEARRAVAESAFLDWSSHEAASIRKWITEQARAFVIAQHEHTAKLGAEGVRSLREAAEALADEVSSKVAASLVGVRRHDGDGREGGSVRSVESVRAELIGPLVDLLASRGYSINEYPGGSTRWYSGEPPTLDRWGTPDLGDDAAQLARSAYADAVEQFRRAVDARAKATRQAGQDAAAGMWG